MKRVRYASNKAVQKAHKRAIRKFASMFRKLADVRDACPKSEPKTCGIGVAIPRKSVIVPTLFMALLYYFTVSSWFCAWLLWMFYLRD